MASNAPTGRRGQYQLFLPLYLGGFIVLMQLWEKYIYKKRGGHTGGKVGITKTGELRPFSCCHLQLRC